MQKRPNTVPRRRPPLRRTIVDRREHLATLKAHIADLEAQISTQRALTSSTSTARLNTMIAISSALLVTHELEAILQLVVQQIPDLFPGAPNALIYLTDTENRLVLRAANTDIASKVLAQPAIGMATHAFLAPRAMLLAGPELENLIEDQDSQYIDQTALLKNYWPPACALLAPLRSSHHRLGALVLYSKTSAHLLMPRDLPFIQAVADLTAAAINETRQRARAAALERDLVQTRSQHAEAREQLSAAQAQLLQSAKLAAVGELSASVAHEINNPLYAARNSLYLVEEDLPTDSPQRPFLEIAQTELGRIARIITRMRDFYRPSRAELEPTAINDIIEETMELVQTHMRHGQVTATLNLAPDLPRMIAHPDQIRQVFLNLVLNACDAMPNGGVIEVITALLGSDFENDLAIVITVADTGMGIPAEHLPHIFEPFYTTKPQGTGLGLAISAHIVTQQGGTLNANSVSGQGTTFTITFPIRV